MDRFFRLILNFCITIALICFFITPPAHSFPTTTTADDFSSLG